MYPDCFSLSGAETYSPRNQTSAQDNLLADCHFYSRQSSSSANLTPTRIPQIAVQSTPEDLPLRLCSDSDKSHHRHTAQMEFEGTASASTYRTHNAKRDSQARD